MFCQHGSVSQYDCLGFWFLFIIFQSRVQFLTTPELHYPSLYCLYASLVAVNEDVCVCRQNAKIARRVRAVPTEESPDEVRDAA